MEGKDDCYFTASVFRWILFHVPRGYLRLGRTWLGPWTKGVHWGIRNGKIVHFLKEFFWKNFLTQFCKKNPDNLRLFKTKQHFRVRLPKIVLFFKFQSTMNQEGCPFLISHLLVINSFLKITPQILLLSRSWFFNEDTFHWVIIIDQWFHLFLRKIYLRSTSFLS